MNSSSPFPSGKWENEYGDALSICKLFGRHYCVIMNVVSIDPAGKCYRYLATEENDVLVFGHTYAWGQGYYLELQEDGSVEIAVVPELGEHIAEVDWIKWNDRACKFVRMQCCRHLRFFVK